MKTLAEKDMELSVQLEGRLRKPSVLNLPVKLAAGKIVKQGGKINTERKT